MQKQGLERKLKKILKFFENVPIRDLTAGSDQSLNSGRKEIPMEYVVFKGGGEILYTVRQDEYDFEINYFGHNSQYHTVELPTDVDDLECFRDSLNEILTEVIEKKRSKKND